jgi:hypothetical protein
MPMPNYFTRYTKLLSVIVAKNVRSADLCELEIVSVYAVFFNLCFILYFNIWQP